MEEHPVIGEQILAEVDDYGRSPRLSATITKGSTARAIPTGSLARISLSFQGSSLLQTRTTR